MCPLRELWLAVIWLLRRVSNMRELLYYVSWGLGNSPSRGWALAGLRNSLSRDRSKGRGKTPGLVLFRISLAKLCGLLLVFLVNPVAADHGPLTTAAGASVMSAEPLKKGGVILSLSSLFTSYERLTEGQIADLTQRASGDVHVDSLRLAILTTGGIDYGLTSRWDLGLRLPWYRAERVREGLKDSGGNYRLLELGNVSGLADPSLRTRYLLWDSVQDFLNLQLVVKAPWGKTSSLSQAKPLRHFLPSAQLKPTPLLPHVVTPSPNANPLNDLYYVEPALMPGSGAWDFAGGLAYTHYLAPTLSFSWSGQYTRRGSFEKYKLGDMVETGLAMAQRWGSREELNLTFFTELIWQYRATTIAQGQELTNTGGQLWQASWGILLGFPSGLSIMASSQLPVVQWLREPQQRLTGRYWLAVNYAP